MPTHLNPPFKHRTYTFPSQPIQFQRGKGKINPKKIKRKAKLKFRHILFSFFLLGGIFYFIQQAYLWLISWDNLNIKNVAILCSKNEVKEEIQRYLEGRNLGNLLLFDISHLQKAFTSHRWIKEVSVRKILPATLKIEVKERSPAALLKKRELYLIDEEGVLLEKIEPGEEMNLPLLIDSNNFQEEYEEKLKSAWKCLTSLSYSEKEQLGVLDLTDYNNVIVQLKNKQTRLILGNDHFAQRLKSFQKYSSRLDRYGELEYVDLRFDGRIYIKPKNNPFGDFISNSYKEAN